MKACRVQGFRGPLWIRCIAYFKRGRESMLARLPGLAAKALPRWRPLLSQGTMERRNLQPSSYSILQLSSHSIKGF